MKLTHFQDSEFDCKHCGLNAMQESFLVRLDKAREIAGIPFVINSGFRCLVHNRNIGSSDTSSHPKGRAADIRCRTSRSRFRVFKGLMDAGFTRIGIRPNFIHVDSDPDKSPEVVWIYD